MIALIYKRLIQLGKVSGAVSFLFAAPYAFFQYLQSESAGRVEQTLSMFKLYNAAPFTGYREKLTKALADNKGKINDAAKDPAALEALQFQIIKEQDLEAPLLLLFDFFDAVAVCVTSRVCDNDAAVKLFRPRAADIYVNFYQYMITQRGKTATRGFGIGLESIAKAKLEDSSFWHKI